ncbi:MAG: EamA family transporter [Pseudobutyrivibrio sp.]|nr:EamA family transporter [Pseudobutyrivibrio sp.]
MIVFMIIMLTGTFISSIAQIMLKKAAQREYPNKLAEYLNPLVIFAYAIFFSATFCALYAYKVVPLSLGPILEATGYIWVAIMGKIFLGERISKRKSLGLVVIIIGIAIASSRALLGF